MRACMYVHVYVFCVHVHTCMCVRTCVHVRSHVCTCMYLCVNGYVLRVCMCDSHSAHVCMYVRAHACVRACVCISRRMCVCLARVWVQVYMCVCVHVCVRVCVCTVCRTGHAQQTRNTHMQPRNRVRSLFGFSHSITLVNVRGSNSETWSGSRTC